MSRKTPLGGHQRFHGRDRACVRSELRAGQEPFLLLRALV